MNMKNSFMKGGQVAAVVLCLCMSLVFAASCSKEKKARKMLSQEVVTVNADCPMEIIPGILSLNQFHLGEDWLAVDYRCANASASLYRGLDASLYKEQMLPALIGSLGTDFLQAMIDCGVGFRMTFSDESGARLSEISLTVDELKRYKDMRPGDMQPSSFLETCRREIESAQLNLPLNMGDGVVMTDYSLDGHTLVYTYTVEGVDYYPTEALDVMRSTLANVLRETYGSQLPLIKAENVLFRYVYHNAAGQVIADLTIDGQEL